MLSPEAANAFVTFAASDPKNNFLAKRLGYCADCNTLDDVPKVDGFFSLTPRESDEMLSLFYSSRRTGIFRVLKNFLGVSQITAPGRKCSNGRRAPISCRSLLPGRSRFSSMR